MPIEWVVAGMGTIITVLGGTIGLLWRNHLARDEDLRTENRELRAIAADSSKNIGSLVPAVRELTDAVEVVDKRAIERYETIRRDVRDFRDEHHRDIDSIGRRGAR